MRAIAAIVLLLALAIPAHAKTIKIVGDSYCVGGVLYPGGVGYRVSPHEPGRTLRQLTAKRTDTWLNATVENWCVSGSTPVDWSTAPNATLCTNEKANYPHLKSACAAAAPIMNYIGSGADLVIVIDNGTATGLTTSQYVDALVVLRDALDAVNTTIWLTAPPHGPAAGNIAMPADSSRADKLLVDAEMNSRGIINGPDWRTTDFPMSIDTIHFRDHGYATITSALAGALP